MRIYFNIFCLLFLLSPLTYSQFDGRPISLSVNAVYTTTAKMYLNPNSSDIVLRNNYFLLEDIISPAVDIRYRLTEPLIIGLNVEYMNKTDFGSRLRVDIGVVEIEEGFNLIPIELSLYYILPFSTEKFKFLMGGGGGYYIGEHIRKFGDAEIESIEKQKAYGIHVSISMEYLLKENIGIRTEMKFRDPQFNLTNKYSGREVNYKGETVNLLQDQFDSKVNVDGVTFVLGLTFNF